MKKKIKKIKEQWLLWRIRWNVEPQNCVKILEAWFWFLPLFLTFNITFTYDKE